MGKLYYNLGFLATDAVVEITVRDLIAQFVGQTRQKTKDQLTQALGKVLIIDNACQLLKGPYELEALQEIINCLQSEGFSRKMIIILVGYSEGMKMLRKACPPLAGLFPHEVKFSRLKTKDCMRLLKYDLEKLNVSAPFLADESCDEYHRLERLIHALAIAPMFANAKDITCLAQSMKTTLFEDFFEKKRASIWNDQTQSVPSMPDLAKAQAADCVKRLICQRRCTTPLLPPCVPLPEPEYSDDDPRFARAFDYEQTPEVQIEIQKAIMLPQLPSVSHEDEPEILNEALNTELSLHATVQVLARTVIFGSRLPWSNFPKVHGTELRSMSASDCFRFDRVQDCTQHQIGEFVNDDDSDGDQPSDSVPSQTSAIASSALVDTNMQEPQSHALLIAAFDNDGESVEQVSPQASLKRVDEMSIEEKRRYRDMLKHRYPFEEAVSLKTEQALRKLGCCPHGFAWKRDSGRHICEGGTHYGYDFDVRDHMYRHEKQT